MHGMAKACDNCPFRTDGGAIPLAPGRLDGIKRAVLLGQPFYCHKTVHSGRTEWTEDDDGTAQPAKMDHWQECRGALDYRSAVLLRDPGAAARALEELLRDL